MKTYIRTASAVVALLIGFAATAQNSLPPPGSVSRPRPSFAGGAFYPGGIWGSQWNSPMSSPAWQQPGTMNVISVGYDARGVWRTVPLTVSYDYNGVQYNVTVVNAWDPWTDSWDMGVNSQAFNTSYYLNGVTYGFYTVLSTGTFYFNL